MSTYFNAIQASAARTVSGWWASIAFPEEFFVRPRWGPNTRNKDIDISTYKFPCIIIIHGMNSVTDS